MPQRRGHTFCCVCVCVCVWVLLKGSNTNTKKRNSQEYKLQTANKANQPKLVRVTNSECLGSLCDDDDDDDDDIVLKICFQSNIIKHAAHMK